jgi:hypothetical protein
MPALMRLPEIKQKLFKFDDFPPLTEYSHCTESI